MKDGLWRCSVCSQYTLASPLLVLRSWRMHLPACFECSTSEAIDLRTYVRPVHTAVGQAMLALFVTGRWCWKLKSSNF